MIYSVSSSSAYKGEAGEIRVDWNKLGELVNISNSQRYNVNVTLSDFELQYEKRLAKFHEQVRHIATSANYTLCCSSIALARDLIERGYNVYLKFPVTDWETFHNLKSLGVSDIVIDGPLCFQGEALKKAKGNMKIRMSPVISPNNSIVERRPNSFFILPQDLSLYEDVIDVLDFLEYNQEREDTLYTIYKRGSFHFTIDNLIPGLPSISNMFFDKKFAEMRFSCGQACLIPGKSCHVCDNYMLVRKHTQEFVEDFNNEGNKEEV